MALVEKKRVSLKVIIKSFNFSLSFRQRLSLFQICKICLKNFLMETQITCHIKVCRIKIQIQKQPPEVFFKKVFLEIWQNSQESTSARVKKETLAQMFSYEFCKIFKNTFSHRTPPVAVSGDNYS